MLSFLSQYKGNLKFSQNGEELILLEILRRLNLPLGHAAEIGGSNGFFCSNTALLLEQGWSGLFVEGQYNLYLESKENWQHNPRVRHQCCYVDERNINAFVDNSCDLVSLDTDGSDYRIFAGIIVRPKIVIVEIDSSIPPDSYEFNSDGAAGYARMVELGLERGYFLLAHTGNLVFLRDQYKHLFPEVEGHPLLDHELYFSRSWLKEVAA